GDRVRQNLPWRRSGRIHHRRFDPPDEGRFRRTVAANMAVPRTVVRRGPESQVGLLALRPGAAACWRGDGATSCEIKTLSRVASVSDNPLRMTHSAPNPVGENRTGARVVRVPDDRAGQRLDNFLLGQLKGVPKSLIYKLIRSGQVRINGGRAKAERKLEGGEEVRIPPVRLAEPGDKPTPPTGFMHA